ncbi:uncharacterized protein [Diadema setosum]|uniref:uncharacterized protein n=1 Tax=Diadema setosum TaxID=31175 RepID=UPI003B3A54A3
MARLTKAALATWVAMATLLAVSTAPSEYDACRGTCDKFPDRYCETWNAICELCPAECRDSRECGIPKCARYFQGSSTPPTTSPTTILPAQSHLDQITTLPSRGVADGGPTAALMRSVAKPARPVGPTEKEREAPPNNGAGTTSKGGSSNVGMFVAVSASGVVLALGVVVYHRKNRRQSSERRPQCVASDEERPPIIGEESGPIGGAALVGEDQIFLPNHDQQPPIQESRV